MELFKLTAISLLLVTCCSGVEDSGNNDHQGYLNESLISLTALLGEEMYTVGNQTEQNMVFSGINLLGTLIQINSVAYEKVSREIQEALGVFGILPLSWCEAFNTLASIGTCYNAHNFSVSFHRNLFYDQSLHPFDGPLINSCFQNDFSEIDFVNQSETVTEINKWYSNLPPRSHTPYMTEHLDKTTRFVIMNVLKFPPLNNLGYTNHEGVFSVYNVRGSTLQFPSMEKIGEYYYQGHRSDFSASLLREDLPGGRHSLVFLMVHGQAKMHLNGFKKIFTPKTFKRHFNAAFDLKTKVKKKLILPEVNLNTSINLQRFLENMCVTSLFRQDRPLKKLFDSKAKVNEMPHVNSFNFVADSTEQIVDNYTESIEVNIPFWLILADRNKQIPLSNVLFLGLGGIDISVKPT